MSHELRGWIELYEVAPLESGLALVAVAAALFVSGFALVAGPRLRAPGPRLLVTGATLLATGGCLTALLLAIAGEREMFLGYATGALRPAWLEAVFTLLREQQWLALSAVLLTLAVPLTIVGLARCARSGHALGYAAAFVAFVAGACASVDLAQIRDALWASGYAGDRAAFLRYAFAESAARFDLSVCIVATAAVTALSVVLFARRRTRVPLGRRATVGAGVVFVLGALAFAGTRGHAYDRSHRVSLRTGTAPLVSELPRVPDWIDAASCAPLVLAPIIELTDAEHAWIDGRAGGSIRMRQDLETLRRNYAILHPGEAFPGIAVVAAPRDMSARLFHRWLSEIRAAGYSSVQVAFVTHEPVVTSTRGEVDVMRPCGVTLRTDFPALVLERTVEDVVRQAHGP